MVAPVRCATPGHRGRLREIAAVLGEIDDPVRQHAAAFAADRDDGDGDRPRRLARGVHAAPPLPPALARPCVAAASR